MFPFNPERVLKDLPKPSTEMTTADRVAARPHLQNSLPTMPMTPVTPVTPVSTEGLISLQHLIINQDATSLDKASKTSLKRHLQKLAKAAETSLAKGALQQDQIQFLLRINNESKDRRSTKSIVLGKAKVMSFEDIAEARTRRSEKEATKEKKISGKRGRKRKIAALEANTPETSVEVAQDIEALESTRATTQVSETQVTGGAIVPGSWTAPKALMW